MAATRHTRLGRQEKAVKIPQNMSQYGLSIGPCLNWKFHGHIPRANPLLAWLFYYFALGSCALGGTMNQYLGANNTHLICVLCVKHHRCQLFTIMVIAPFWSTVTSTFVSVPPPDILARSAYNNMYKVFNVSNWFLEESRWKNSKGRRTHSKSKNFVNCKNFS